MKLSLNSAISDFSSQRPVGERRADLIGRGRILALEAAMREHNKALKMAGASAIDYASAVGDGFERAAQDWGREVLLFCADAALKPIGISYDKSNINSYVPRDVLSCGNWLYALSGIVSETQRAVTPYIVNDMLGETMSVIFVQPGKTGEVKVESNAVIKWYDSTWTSLRSVPQDQLYNGCITLNPTPKSARFQVNLYQLRSNPGNLVNAILAVARGFAEKLMDSFTQAFMAAADANAGFIPSARRANGYTGDNWAAITRNVAAANHVKRPYLFAYGDYLALRKVVPDHSGLAAAIMDAMGAEYFKNGFIGKHDGVTLYELQPTVKSDTVNTTMAPIWPTDMIVISARANRSYAPMVCGMEEDGDGRVSLTPGEDAATNGYIEGLAWASYDIQPAFASAIGIIESVV